MTATTTSRTLDYMTGQDLGAATDEQFDAFFNASPLGGLILIDAAGHVHDAMTTSMDVRQSLRMAFVTK